VLVEFAGPATFDNYIGLKDFLESLLGNQVDLITRKSIKPRFAKVIERDLVDVA
jgi:predicted nucleotidyltransferase